MTTYTDIQVAELLEQSLENVHIAIARKGGASNFIMFTRDNEIIDYINSLRPNRIITNDKYLMINLIGSGVVLQFINEGIYTRIKEYMNEED